VIATEPLRERFPTERAIDRLLTEKMRRRGSRPYRPQTSAEIEARLHGFLARRLTGGHEVRDLRVLAGGSSKEQVAFTLGAGGDERRLVLRLQPAESFVETDRLREFQVIRSLRGTIPVPEALWVDPDGSELGQPGLVCSFETGIARPPQDGPYRPRQGYGPRYRARLAPQFVDHCAAIARHDWSATGMSAFDAPEPGTNEGVISLLNWWQRVWEEDCLERCPLLTVAAHWLRANAPEIDVVSIVHGDLRGGNFLFDPGTAEITAVLDWETAHLGDRHEDLGLMLSPLFAERDDDGTELVCGLMEREAFLGEYERLTGLPVDPHRLAYYTVFTAWRSAVNSLGTAPRCVTGRTTSQDVRVAWTAASSAVVLECLRRSLERSM
jgi:aminoglycoside phosphotransferase (APT) family kinase protein